MRLADAVDLAVSVARTAHEHDVRYPAAALAYYGFVAFVPLLVLAFSVMGQRLAGRVYTTTPQFLPPGAQGLVYDAMTAASGKVGATLLAIAALAWSGANVAVDFRTVVERVEGAPEGSLAEQVRDAAVVLVIIALAIVSIALTSTLFVLIPGKLLATAIGAAALVVVLTLIFVPLYYVPSSVVDSPRAALPGAVTAAVGWTVIHAAIQYYVIHAARYAIYGVLSGIILILSSLYVAAVVLLLGIVVNAMLRDGVAAPARAETVCRTGDRR